MEDNQRRAVTCPQCSKQILAPADRGRLRITCKGCSHQFDWSPDGTAPSEPAPATTSTTSSPAGRGPKKGVQILLICTLIVFALSLMIRVFNLESIETPPLWLALGGLAVSLVLCFWLYRGVRLLTGLHPVLSIVLVGFVSAAPGMLASLVPQDGLSGIQEQIAAVNLGAGIGAQDSAGGDYFEGLNANNTDVAELDAIIEDW